MVYSKLGKAKGADCPGHQTRASHSMCLDYDPQTPQKLIPPPPGRFGAAIGKAVVAGPTTAGLRWVEWG